MRPSVCTSCRLHIRLHARLRLLESHRRGLSHSNSVRQEAIRQRGYWDQDRTRREVEIDTGTPARRRASPTAKQSSSEEPVLTGRYSGRALRPEELLHQLNDSDGPNRRVNISKHIAGTAEQDGSRDHHAPGPWLPPQIREMSQRFITSKKSGRSDHDAWDTLRSIVDKHRGDTHVARLGKNKWFVISYLRLVMRCCREFGKEAGKNLPAPSKILALSPTLGVAVNDAWARALWETSKSVMDLRALGLNQEDFNACVQELMVIWNMALASRLKRDGTLDRREGQSLDWSMLPDSVSISNLLGEKAYNERPSFHEGLAMMLPRPSPVDASAEGTPFHDFASPALATHHLLQATDSALRFNHEPFLQLLETLYKHAPLHATPVALRGRLDYTLSGSSPNLKEEWTAVAKTSGLRRVPRSLAKYQVPQAAMTGQAQPLRADEEPVDEASLPKTNSTEDVPSAEAVTADIMGPPAAPPEDEVGVSETPSDRFVTQRINVLSQAVQRQNLALAESVKDQVFAYAADPQKPALPDRMFEHLMLTMLSLRSPKSAVAVWNHFIQSGRQPTARTYSIMMRGSIHVRDLNGMQSIWSRMRSAGVQPDAHAWSTLVFGLMRGARIGAGFEALSRMSQEWFAAAHAKQASIKGVSSGHKKRNTLETPRSEILTSFLGDIDGVPRPNVIVLNSAISGLAATGDHEVPRVLAWGRTFGLEPDQMTFNVLLKMAMIHGRVQEALALLKQMRDRGFEGNSATFTIILSSLFEDGNLHELSHEEQYEHVLAFMDSLAGSTSAGIDEKGYAIVIDRLLKYYSNTLAANAVLQHMIDHGKRPSSAIYTSLMTSCFQRQPPDFAAAEALWAHIQTRNADRGAHLDSLFYDRMIEGYASHHQDLGTRPMLDFIERMTAQGKQPSWRALELAARALAERREWNRLLQIVDDVRRWVKEGRGEMHVGGRDYGERGFWDFVVGTGLLRDEGVTSDQLSSQQGRGKVIRGTI